MVIGTALVAATAQGAAARGALSTAEVLRAFFPESERVGYVEIGRAELIAAAGARAVSAPRERYVVYVARSGDHIDGYAVVDDEKGQHEPITFAVRLDAAARVTRVQVLAYREAYGDEIRDPRFLHQLEGATATSRLQLDDDVDGITGATISARSTTVVVRRAAALAEAARKKATRAPGTP